ncbi:MAG: aldehyde dehydrogenase family protein [Actinomycetota bacterium]
MRGRGRLPRHAQRCCWMRQAALTGQRQVSRWISRESGTPISESSAEVRRAAASLRYSAGHVFELHGEVIRQA